MASQTKILRGHSPVLCSLPPHILEAVIRNGSGAQRAWALRTLVASERFRGRRHALSAMAFTFAVPAGEKRRTIYDAKNGLELPGTLTRGEGGAASKDPAVNEAYDGLGDTYDFYWTAFQRKSIDNRGLRLDGTVHYNEAYDNAFWNGSQMVFGDGDGELFKRFTLSLDVIGHELTHGVTQAQADLNYQGQSGALNESMSDVFGSLVKQYKRKQSAGDADWLIGAELLEPRVKGVALRSMKAPGTAYNDPILEKDPQPADMKHYVKSTSDNGGVHINSGIPNHAFYLAAMKFGGFSWEKAGKVWYVALCERLTSDADFSQAAQVTTQVAKELFGATGEANVKGAWAAVGL